MRPPADLIDDIYAAAFLPSLWPRVLDRLTEFAGGFGTVMLAMQGEDLRWIGTVAGAAVMEEFVSGGWMRHNQRAVRDAAMQHPGFLTNLDMFTPEELDADPLHAEFLRPRGLGWNFGTTVTAPSGDLIALNTEFRYEHGPVSTSIVEAVDPLRPHFARAALMSARLRLEEAATATRTLEALGLPAAVLDHRGRAIAINSLFHTLAPRLVTRADDRIGLSSRAAAAMLEQAVATLRQRDSAPCSFPVRGDETGPPLILHLVPIRREAHDLFSTAAGVLVATPVQQSGPPTASLLQGLFDLSPAEARVARKIAGGQNLEAVAAALGTSRETVRHQLKVVFQKTGTNRQAELVLLLSGAKGFSAA